MYDVNKWNESEENNNTQSYPEGQGSETNASQNQTTYGQDSQAAASQGHPSQTAENRSQGTYGQNSQAAGGQNQGAYGQEQQRRQVYGQLGQSQTGYNQSAQSQNRTGYSQNGQYYHGSQTGANGQNHGSYSNPYQYNYYQTSNGNQNSGSNSHRSPKKKSLVKSTAMVTAAALLFGVVSGGTMFGVNRAAQILFPVSSETSTETQSSLQSTTPVEATPQSSQQSSGGVVIEDVSPIVDEVMPSVVAITNTMVLQGNTWFGQSQTYEIPSSGSGIIVGENDSELLIVTNNHVIEGADSLAVTFIDNSTVEAAIKGTDSESDLAVIAIPLEDISADTKTQIKAATLGDSDALKMGQGVIAIGNALGLGQSVTVGHVSALNREITVDGVTKTVIQTDAAINPGNSGGALLNSKGEVIGINEAKYADTDVEGVGYAIPISQAKDIIEDLMNRTTKIAVDEAEQGYLGVQIQNIDSSMSRLYGMPEGVYVYKIVEDSAAADSELREKDIITALDGEKISNYTDLTELLTYYKAGSTITLTVQRLENGEYVEREVQITLKNRPVEETQAAQQ